MKIKILVGVFIFVVAYAVQLLLLRPDFTPQLLTGRAWLPSTGTSSKLLTDRNIQKQRGGDTTIDFGQFKGMTFEESDVVVVPAVSSHSDSPYLDYFGRDKGGKFFSAVLGVDELLPARSPVYTSDWQTYTFDRGSGEIRVENVVNYSVFIAVFVVALVLAASFGFLTPQNAGEVFYWAVLLVCGGLNCLVFYLWQLGRPGFAVEAGIFVFTTGIIALWCFILVWWLQRDEKSTLVGQISYSLVFLAVGVVGETFVTAGLFGPNNASFLEFLALAVLFSLVALAIDIFIVWGEKSDNPRKVPSVREA